MSPVLDLKSASDALGVHYQTAYRWVRSGRLPAQRVNGKYQLDSADVERLARERSLPARTTVRTPRGGFGRLASRTGMLLADGSETELRRLVADLTDNGVPLTQVISEVIAPALTDIGRRWSDGALDIATEHRASAIVERVLGEFMPSPRGRRRGTAVVVALAGDLHSLPTSMAAAALREDNWRVQHLGADVPAEEIAAFCRREDPDLLVLTVTSPDVRPAALDLAASLQAEGRRTLVGGAGDSLADLTAAARG